MNKQRRKTLSDLQSRLEETADEIETALGEEQDYYDATPEGIQSGEKGDTAQEAINELEQALGQVRDAISGLENAASQ